MCDKLLKYLTDFRKCSSYVAKIQKGFQGRRGCLHHIHVSFEGL